MPQSRPPAASMPLPRVALWAVVFWLAFIAHSLLYKVVLDPELVDPAAVILRSLHLNLLMVLLAAGVSLAAWPLLRQISGLPAAPQALGAIAVIAVAGGLFEPLQRRTVGVLGGERKIVDFTPVEALKAWLFWIAPFGLWTVGGLALLHQARAQERERDTAHAQAEAQASHMRALHYQISPHFLFNTLNSISSLILSRSYRKAEAMVTDLARFFRATLDTDPLADARLADEIELQRRYLAIERMRFADFLEVVFDVPEALAEARVPPLILQPLVENAIKHGLHGPGRVTTLTVTARRDGEELLLDVADDGRGAPARGKAAGVGLANVEARLATRFGARAHMSVEPGPPGFAVRLRMPLVTAA